MIRALAVLGFLFGSGALAQTAEPIRSRADLEQHLRVHATDSPMNALSPGARERFLYSLRFGSQGLSSASGVDLGDELTQPQILAIMELFGPEAVANSPQSHSEELQWLERRVRSRDEIGDIERRYNDYFKAVVDIGDVADRERAALRAAAFQRLLADLYQGRKLTKVDDRELRLLRRAAQEVAMETPDDNHVAVFQQVFSERQRRNLLSTDDVTTMQALFLARHRYSDARRLASDYPTMKLPRLPQFRDPLKAGVSAPTVWRFDAAGKQLTREVMDLTDAQILVTGRCDSLRSIAASIEADPVLGPVFTRHARWITEAPGIESLDAVREWNAALPGFPMAMIHERGEWALVPRWYPPGIHVISDGNVAATWQGSLAQRESLVTLLQRHGLLE